MADLTKLNLHSDYPAFINNNIWTGTLTISGSTSGGTNVRTFTIDLGLTPDLTDIVFNGPTDSVFGSDPRPADGWFKRGKVWVRTNNAGGGDPSMWTINSSINGTVVTVTAIMVQTFSTSETLTSTNFSYRIIDYSVF